MTSRKTDDICLIVHIVFRFDYGGLENGVVNIINGLPEKRFRHVVVALSDASDFADRLKGDVPVKCIGKKAGKDIAAYLRLYRLLRQLRPDIVHTRNFGTLDCALVAFLARVPVRIHGEHGWDIFDPDGTRKKYKILRRIFFLFVQKIVAVSHDLKHWLVEEVGITESKIQHITNGVDTNFFRPAKKDDGVSVDQPIVVGSVTRFSPIKDPLNLVNAFIKIQSKANLTRLAMVGDGELLQIAKERIAAVKLERSSWLPGSRDDIADQLRTMDIFVLGSLKEGISNTVLEAMATGLPIIASDTGGNSELIEDGLNGALVPPADSDALAREIQNYVVNPRLRIRHGKASRERAVSRFSIERMIEEYNSLYCEAVETYRT